MAERIEAAGETDLRNGQFCIEQHTGSDSETIVDDVAVRRAAGSVLEEPRERVRIHAGHIRQFLQRNVVHIVRSDKIFYLAYAFVFVFLLGADK